MNPRKRDRKERRTNSILECIAAQKGLRKEIVEKEQERMKHKKEADEGWAIRKYELGDDTNIITVDKDLDMVTGWNYNFVKQER